MAARHLVLIAVATSLLAGCVSAPTARLATSRVSGADVPLAPAAAVQAPAAALPAPVVKTIPGFAGPQPTVAVKAGAAPAAPALAVAAQTAAADVVAADSELEALDLLADSTGATYGLQGWWQDLKDSIKRSWQRFTLKREIKAALKHKNEKAFELHEGEIDNIKKNRTEPKTEVNDLGGGGKEIVTTWASTNKGTWEIETRRTIDADGTTQVLAVRQSGEDKGKLRITIERVRTLVGADGAYQVKTVRTVAYKDGRVEKSEWTKAVAADGSERIDGYITHRDGSRTQITGTRDVDGKVKVEVSEIAEAHNPAPLPSTDPYPTDDGEDDEATGAAN